jgi:protein SCO1/2
MKKKFIIFITSIILLSLGFLFVTQYMQNQKEIEQYAFTMDSIDGKVSLSDFDDKYKIIYYGYMYCPDICPTSLSIVASALNKLPKEQADKFQLIFISVDPDRDKVKELKEYANYFYEGAIGITSNEKYLKTISANYGTYYANEYLENSKIDYSVAHTSFVYIMGKDGKLLHKLKHLEKTSDVLNAIKSLY